jgi:hypothetical protein
MTKLDNVGVEEPVMTDDRRPKAGYYPALRSLALSQQHLEALAKQGSLSAEGSKGYFKLRFRMGSQQQVRYVGGNSDFVALVEKELAALQARTRSCRELCRLMAEARRRLRATKRQLEPWLPLAGRSFHGREIRRRLAACQDTEQ